MRVVYLVAGCCSSVVAQNNDEPTREIVRQWVVVERLLGEEIQVWKAEQKQVAELLNLYEKEIHLLDEELGKAGQGVGQEDQARQELETRVADGMKKRKKLRQFLIQLTPRVLAVEKRLPEVLQKQVADSVGVLKMLNDETSVRELLQATAQVIEQANQF